MKKKRRPIPAFKNEAQERAFWESQDSSGYVDWSQAERIRSANLKPSTQTISLSRSSSSTCCRSKLKPALIQRQHEQPCCR